MISSNTRRRRPTTEEDNPGKDISGEIACRRVKNVVEVLIPRYQRRLKLPHANQFQEGAWALVPTASSSGRRASRSLSTSYSSDAEIMDLSLVTNRNGSQSRSRFSRYTERVLPKGSTFSLKLLEAETYTLPNLGSYIHLDRRGRSLPFCFILWCNVYSFRHIKKGNLSVVIQVLL